MRYKITLSYNGAPFCGWQKQPSAPSVQETLENALSVLTGEAVQVTGAGRTDTGVSAVGYVAHFDAQAKLDESYIACKLNAILPVSVAVSEIVAVAEDFHARFDAKSRTYTYFLHRSKDPFAASWSYQFSYPDVDFDLMNKAAALLLGTHDFSCFQKVGSDNKTTVCTVFEAGWQPYTPPLPAWPSQPCSAPGTCQSRQYWFFRISADRFLRNMVRAIVGTLLEVGRGKRSLDNFAKLLEGGSRSNSGESAPGHALFLSKIDY